MTQVNFSGSGTDSFEEQVGKGQGLQVGITKIDFSSGKISLDDGKTIGVFRTLKKKGSNSNEVRTFSFKSATKCTVKFQDTFIDYNLINEWLILQGIQTEEISISRIATGISPDIFPFSFIASDDVNYKISIEKGTRDSDVENVLESASRAIDTYYQTINVQGAKKLILLGKATAEGGTATVTAEIFDPASQSWMEHIPVEDLFTLINGESKRAQIGDTLSRIPRDEEIIIAWAKGGTALKTNKIGEVAGTPIGSIPHVSGAIGSNIGYVLPSGDNLFRIKVVVTTANLTFSLGVIKVFE